MSATQTKLKSFTHSHSVCTSFCSIQVLHFSHWLPGNPPASVSSLAGFLQHLPSAAFVRKLESLAHRSERAAKPIGKVVPLCREGWSQEPDRSYVHQSEFLSLAVPVPGSQDMSLASRIDPMSTQLPRLRHLAKKALIQGRETSTFSGTVAM